MAWNLEAFLKISEARVLTVCDVFADRREKAREKVNTAYGNTDSAMYTDFREILARGDIGAVVISTPDHWHVLMAVMAARAGKDVFCEKSTLNVEQGQVLIDVMKETGVVYQGGIEDRSVEQYYRLAELVRNGRIGKLERILVTLPTGEVFEKEEEEPVPEGLDYDLWLGPAPYTPYTPSMRARPRSSTQTRAASSPAMISPGGLTKPRSESAWTVAAAALTTSSSSVCDVA